jgi:type I restriction enzyme M protein
MPKTDASFVRSPAVFESNRSLIRDLRNYLAGQVVGITRDEALLDEVLKCAFCKVAMERRGDHTAGLAEDEMGALYGRTFGELRQELYLLDLGADLRLGPSHIARIDDVLSKLQLLDPARDVVGDLYETFAGASIRGQEGQFFTPKNAVQALVAMVGPDAGDRVLDPACGAGGFLLEVARFSANASGSLPTLSGIDKDAYLARLARIHVALQFGEQPGVACSNSLSDLATLEETTGYGAASHSVVLTNPPFGAKIVAVAGSARSTFALAHKWKKTPNGTYEATSALAPNTPPQILFVERCLELLDEGGRLGIVLPESALSNSGHRYMVQFLLKQATPRAIVGMPEALFKTSGKGGTHTKVCLAVFDKKSADRGHEIFMAEARWCGHDSRGLPIPNDDLPEIVGNYQAFSSGDRNADTPTGFRVKLSELRSHVLAPRYYDPEPRRQLRRLKRSHHMHRVGDLVDSGAIAIATGHEVGKLAYGTGDIPFVRTSDLSNWEIKVDPKHGVSSELYDTLASKQDVREGDVLMVRDGTYLIGTCAMVTKHDVRIVYQSHLYKLRVADDAPIDEFLLLAALSSPPVRSQIRANSFTMDIIDSLGDRVRDLVLPVPANDAARARISGMVRQVIADRVEARELARRAALEIAATAYPA